MTSAASGWPADTDRVILEEVDSTSAEAARRAPRAPAWILAHRQTGGHGRRGRPWATAPGNFAASLAWRPAGGPAEHALRSFVAALALHDALDAMGVAGLSLKWPNDVLLDGGKVAGILLESAGQGGQIDWLAIGIGVNLVSAPDLRDAAFPPVALGDGAPDADAFLDTLAGHYATEEDILTRIGFEPIREKWLRNAARLGEIITARTGTEELTGRFETVDDQGRLVLVTPDGPRMIPAADVFF